jgi:hypothetical protein
VPNCVWELTCCVLRALFNRAMLALFASLPRNRIVGCFAFYAAVELIFYYRWRRKVYSVSVQPPIGLSPKFDGLHWMKWFSEQLILQPKPKEVIESVFQVPYHEVARERAIHWLCFYLTMRELESYVDACYPILIVQTAEELLSKMEKNGRFELHSNPSFAWLPKSTPTRSTHTDAQIPDFCRIGRGSINAYYKPLVIQAVVLFVRLYTEQELRLMGFQRSLSRDNNHIVFWIRKPRSNRDHQIYHDSVRPLFFMHGLGFGAVPYVHFIRTLLDDSRTVVVPEWPNISLGWADNQKFDGLLPDEYAESISNLVDTLCNSDGSPATTIDVVGHSYVSNLYACWIISVYRERCNE